MYRTVAQLDQLTQQLAQTFPQQCTRIQLPEASVQGRPVFALRLRGAGSVGAGRRGVLLIGGVHARELMNPDMLVELAGHLLVSYRDGTDIVLGARVWPARDVRVMLDSLDIHLVPCTNPDGREYVMTVDDMWRKNRRVNQGSSCVGVDLNRNADFVWGVTEGQTSCQPCADTYVGSAAMSEPEARNVRHLLDTHRVDAFADVHSFSELVLYPWGHANTQTTDPTQRFTTLATGTCQPLPNPFYKEYMLPRDLQRFTTVAQRVVGAISDVRGRVYTPEPGRGLYATTGTNSDYAYSRHIADPAKHKTYGFTLETGPDVGDPRESFHPADPEPIKREAESGVLALIQQSICAIELIGTQALGGLDEVDALRRIRDDTLGRTRPGREWISLFERIQPAVVRAVATDDRFATHAADAIVRAARLSSDHAQRLDAATVTDLLALIQNLDEQAASPEIHAGVNAVRHLLHRMTDHTAADALKDMTRRGPRLG